jgi:hypothetical protein
MKKQSKSIFFCSLSIILIIFIPSIFPTVYGYDDEWMINEGDIFEFDFQVNFNSTDSGVLWISNFTFQIEILNLSSDIFSLCELEYTPIEVFQDDFNYTENMHSYNSQYPTFSISGLLMSKSVMDFYTSTYWNSSFYEDELYDPDKNSWDNYGKYQNLTVYPYGFQYIQDLDPDNMMGWDRLEILELYNDLGVLKRSQYNITNLDNFIGMWDLTLLTSENQNSISVGTDFIVFSCLTICIYIVNFNRNQKKKF